MTLGVLATLLVACVALRMLAGGLPEGSDLASQVLDVRAGRAAACVIVGAALAVAGVLLQALLRNPLASPDLLGLASGAGLGVMVSVYLGYLSGFGIAHAAGLGTTGAALLGAMGALVLVLTLSRSRGMLDPVSLVLIGVVVSIICSAGVLLLKHLMPDRGVAAEQLLLGAIRDDTARSSLWAVGIVVGVCVALGFAAGPSMDASALSEDEARSVGVPLAKLRVLLFVLSGVMTAGAVLLAGPIGFVGLICPHAVRLCAGPTHRPLVIGSALAGACLLLLADSLVRVIDLGTGRLPIGVLTSLVGGPMLIVLLRRNAYATR